MKLCSIIPLRLLNFLHSKAIAIANTANDAADRLVIANVTAFAILQGDRVQLSPYGDFAHDAGTQHLSKKEADTIVANFNAQKIALGDKFGGLPWYIGHPDVAAFADRFKDGKSYGWIMDLHAETDGLYANVKWNSEGKQLIEEASYKYLSPTWFIQRGVNGVVFPMQLKSVGFTNTPNIPVAPLANETQTKNTSMKLPEWLLTLLGLGADASEEQTKVAVQALLDAKAAADKKATDVAAENTLRLKTSGDLLANEQTVLVNERAAHVATKALLVTANESRAEFAVANALREGRITVATKESWKKDLIANEAKFAELQAIQPVIKITAKTGNLARLQIEPSKAIGNVQAEVAKYQNETGIRDYNTAFAWVKANKPELFANMKQPEGVAS